MIYDNGEDGSEKAIDIQDGKSYYTPNGTSIMWTQSEIYIKDKYSEMRGTYIE